MSVTYILEYCVWTREIVKVLLIVRMIETLSHSSSTHPVKLKHTNADIKNIAFHKKEKKKKVCCCNLSKYIKH